MKIGTDYKVPAGLLYGIWQNESSGLCGGHGNGRPWQHPNDLVAEEGDCISSYGAERCGKNLAALKAICAQTRMTANGPEAVCDPNTVFTARGLEMGPMQVMPTTFFRKKDGRYVPGMNAVDYDGDGVFDPHSLADSIATAAKILSHRYGLARKEQPELDAHAAWESAANRYNGTPYNTYYSGTPTNRGIRSFWSEWCELTGSCRQVAVASR